jgi:hypothetical protein
LCDRYEHVGRAHARKGQVQAEEVGARACAWQQAGPAHPSRTQLAFGVTEAGTLKVFSNAFKSRVHIIPEQRVLVPVLKVVGRDEQEKAGPKIVLELPPYLF